MKYKREFDKFIKNKEIYNNDEIIKLIKLLYLSNNYKIIRNSYNDKIGYKNKKSDEILKKLRNIINSNNIYTIDDYNNIINEVCEYINEINV